jgi:hypothetical protein
MASEILSGWSIAERARWRRLRQCVLQWSPALMCVCSRRQAAGLGDVLAADGYIFAALGNSPALAGLMKDFFDRCYYPVLGSISVVAACGVYPLCPFGVRSARACLNGHHCIRELRPHSLNMVRQQSCLAGISPSCH